MPCERAEQPLSRSALEDTSVPTPMEIMMAGSPEDICLLACSPQSPGICGGPVAALSREWEPEPLGHVVALELHRAGSRRSSRDDTWQPRSCPELGVGAQAAGTRGSLGSTLSREAGAVVLT
jgi:hypothetical protein